MNSAIHGYVIYYADKYYKLLWEFDKECELGFERRDKEIGVISNTIKDFYFGYYNHFTDWEVELFLYKNRGVQGQVLINTKPIPEFVLISKGEDPGDFLSQIIAKLKKTQGVSSVIPLKMGNNLKIKELIYK